MHRLYAELEARAETDGMSYRDYLAALFAEEVAHRAQTRITRAVKKAHIPYLKTIDELDFTFQTSIRLAQLGSFLGPELVSEGRCAIFYGSTGTGRTHLSIANRLQGSPFITSLMGRSDLRAEASGGTGESGASGCRMADGDSGHGGALGPSHKDANAQRRWFNQQRVRWCGAGRPTT